jgi:biopolymer transport protein ExbD
MFQRLRREIPELNTTSTADISFMLLIFFLVTSSMDTDKGLPRQLPPAPDETQVKELVVKERNVLEVKLDADDRLTVDGEQLTPQQLTARVVAFVANEQNDAQLPEMSIRELHLLGRRQVSDRHVISIQADRHTSYDAYFQMQNAIVAGYRQLRDKLARNSFGHAYDQCSQEEREVIGLVYPQRISEDVPTEKGGQP